MVRSNDKDVHDEFKNLNIVALKWDGDDVSNKNFDEIKGLMKKKYPKYKNLGLGTLFLILINAA